MAYLSAIEQAFQSILVSSLFLEKSLKNSRSALYQFADIWRPLKVSKNFLKTVKGAGGLFLKSTF